MVNHEHYTYRVTWSAEDKEFVGLCAEFPSLSWLAETRSEAMDGIVSVVGDAVAEMHSAGEVVPEPISERKFSGQFVLRILPDLHRKLVLEATEQGVSLNRYIAARLA
ncbi:type II toxin-antitoxin system HicB family antitoxin [Sansalvadorimonas verongulae]|uniref:type II toxin-antitoxin system HicB family antitoxin n=1 Tax=Sansalvadorimonas verongulae TaxID=2172824 RepID=UPI0012BCA9A7|nr:toxin-antitoxin system HicB family antitoxin [Sansalvadorimonas verongulae]MTI12165.1 toxin-antitoxin system HicB family antitoxin [Sansalvadorimonas verongulae]